MPADQDARSVQGSADPVTRCVRLCGDRRAEALQKARFPISFDGSVGHERNTHAVHQRGDSHREASPGKAPCRPASAEAAR